MSLHKKLQLCAVGSHESLQASRLAHDGIKHAVVHLACVTKRREVLLVMNNGLWGFPRRAAPMSGTLILFPDKIIKKELGYEPEQLRGGSPTCADTKLLGQYVDDEDILHFVMCINIFRTDCKHWKYVNPGQSLDIDCDETVQLSASKLGLLLKNELALQAT